MLCIMLSVFFVASLQLCWRLIDMLFKIYQFAPVLHSLSHNHVTVYTILYTVSQKTSH